MRALDRLVPAAMVGLELDTIAAVVILALTGLVVWLIYRRGRQRCALGPAKPGTAAGHVRWR